MRQSATVIGEGGQRAGALGLGMSGDVAIKQVLRDHPGEAVGPAGGGGLHGLIEAVGVGGDDLLELGP